MLRLFPVVEYAVFRETRPGWEIPQRTIHNHELVFITGGQGRVCIRGKPYTAAAGRVFYFYPGQEHSLSACEPPCMQFYAIHFSFTPQDGLSRLPLEDVTQLPPRVPMAPLLQELVQIWQKKPYLHAWRQDQLFSQVLSTLFETLHQPPDPAGLHRISAALEYIHSHPEQPLRLETLCTLSGMGKSHFIRHFRQATGHTPIHYTLLLRLEHSKNTLLNTELPVKAVAHTWGFPDESYYSRLFRQYTGFSPSAFRERNRGRPALP